MLAAANRVSRLTSSSSNLPISRMPTPNSSESLVTELKSLGVPASAIVMVHTALGKVGYTVGGPATLIRAIQSVLGDGGTLVMPCESPQLLDPAIERDPRALPAWDDEIRKHMPVFDPLTTPTTLGAVPEAFRTWPGTCRSNHPLASVCANGAKADEITRDHSLAFGEGRGTPFEKLYDLDAYTLLLGVGFNRCTSLHYAESLTPNRRTTTHRYPIIEDGERVWVENPDMANDDGEHFPVVGERFMASGKVAEGRVGEADALWFRTRDLVDFAVPYFESELT